MRAFSLLLMIAAGCGETTPTTTVACKQVFSGDETASFDCLRSLCTPTGYSFIGLDSMSHQFHLQLTGTLFAPGTYRDADLSADSTLQVSANGKEYLAIPGSMPIPGQSIALVLTEVKQPVQSCDGVIHGSMTATLVQYDWATKVAGPGRVNASITF